MIVDKVLLTFLIVITDRWMSTVDGPRSELSFGKLRFMAPYSSHPRWTCMAAVIGLSPSRMIRLLVSCQHYMFI